uniref:Putative secreted peptide n=1 Tax=Anopheles braziliensis TaxID=58242 RepID=A0A2M3ZQQ1_9DIPT
MCRLMAFPISIQYLAPSRAISVNIKNDNLTVNHTQHTTHQSKVHTFFPQTYLHTYQAPQPTRGFRQTQMNFHPLIVTLATVFYKYRTRNALWSFDRSKKTSL